jgi:hypothetical protein
MSNTPRTDAKQFEMLSDLQSGMRYCVSADFARQLERELNAANQLIHDTASSIVKEREACLELATCEAKTTL